MQSGVAINGTVTTARSSTVEFIYKEHHWFLGKVPNK